MRIKELLNQRISAAMQAAGIPSDCSPTAALKWQTSVWRLSG